MTPMVLAAGPITAPSLSYSGLLPVLIVLGAAAAGVLVEAFVPRESRWAAQVAVAVVGLIAALVAVVAVAGKSELTADSAIAIDGVALFLQGTLLVLGLMSVLLMAERSVDVGGGAFVAQAAVVAGSARDRRMLTSSRIQTELFPLATFSLAGMMVFVSANNLLVMFVALEVLSLPLYLLCGLARRRRLLSQEAAVKYFLLGAFASAFFLYGLALLYGYANSVDLQQILRASSASENSDILLLIQRTMHGPPRGLAIRGLRDLVGREVWAIAPLIALILFLGVYPKPVLGMINPAVARTMQDAGQTDPAPAVPAGAQNGGGR